MENQASYTVTSVDTLLMQKQQERLELYKDFLRISYSKWMNKKKDFDEKETYIDVYEIRYEDVITYRDEGSAIVFYGSFQRRKNKKCMDAISASFSINSGEQRREIVDKIKKLTPVLTLQEKKETYPPERFGRIIIVSPTIMNDFNVWIDREEEGRSSKRQIVLTEPYGKHYVQVEYKQFDMSGEGSETTTIMSEELMVELSDKNPEIHLKTKRGFSEPKLVYAGD